MKTLLITGEFDVDFTKLPTLHKIIHLPTGFLLKDLIPHLQIADAYILGGPEYLSKDLIDIARNLKLLVVMGTGTSSFVDTDYAKQRGIQIYNTPSINAPAVVEFTIAMITNSLAGIFNSIEELKNGTSWIQKPRLSLREAKIGIIGMGAIGKLLVKSLSDRGCTTMYYWSRTPILHLENHFGIQFMPIEMILRKSDLVSIHLPYSPETHHLLDRSLLTHGHSELKIINMSNPRIICPRALFDFLTLNPDSFCSVDGYYREWVWNKGQVNDSEGLLGLGPKHFVATSHIAAQERSTVSAIFEAAATCLRNHISTEEAHEII